MASHRSLGGSTFWRLSETAGNEAISFGVFVVLARLLVPEDFGSVALAGSTMVLMQAVLYHGTTDSLVQLPGYRVEHAQAAMAANLRLATAMIALASVLAWPVALLLGREEFAFILWAMLPSLWLRSLCGPMLAALRRQMDFRSIALRTLLGVATGGGIAMALAWSDAGAWALVAQQWTGEIVGFAVLSATSPIKPWSAAWRRRELDDLLPVALPVMGAQLSNNAARRLDTLAVEWHLGHHAVGIYFLVYRLVFAVQMLTQYGLGDVSLVVLSRFAADTQARNAAVLRVLRLAVLPCGLAFGGLALLAPVLVPLLFGAAWEEAVLPLTALAALAPLGALAALVGVALVAAGQAHRYQRLSIGLAVAQLMAIFLAAPLGLIGVALAIGLAQCLSLPLSLRVMTKGLGLRLGDVLRTLGPLLAIYASTLGGAWLLTHHEGATIVTSLLATAGFAMTFGMSMLVLVRRDWAALSQSVRAGSPGSATSSEPTSTPTKPAAAGAA